MLIGDTTVFISESGDSLPSDLKAIAHIFVRKYISEDEVYDLTLKI